MTLPRGLRERTRRNETDLTTPQRVFPPKHTIYMPTRIEDRTELQSHKQVFHIINTRHRSIAPPRSANQSSYAHMTLYLFRRFMRAKSIVARSQFTA